MNEFLFITMLFLRRSNV